MKKKSLLLLAAALLFLPRTGFANSQNRATWYQMASIANQIESAYDRIHHSARQSQRLHQLADQGEDLSDMLKDYLNPSGFSYPSYRSRAHLTFLYGAIVKNFNAIGVELATLGMARYQCVVTQVPSETKTPEKGGEKVETPQKPGETPEQTEKPGDTPAQAQKPAETPKDQSTQNPPAQAPIQGKPDQAPIAECAGTRTLVLSGDYALVQSLLMQFDVPYKRFVGGM